MWRLDLERDPQRGLSGAHVRIAAERVNFWAGMQWLRLVHTPTSSFVHLLCVAPVREGYLLFRMRLLDADILARDYPEIQGRGLLGEWCLERGADAAQVPTPTLKFLRRCESSSAFLRILQSPRLHPEWLWPAYEGMQEQESKQSAL